MEQGLVEGTNRVVLLTDGQANVGLVQPAQLVGLAEGGAGPRGEHHLHRLRRHYNEDLLEAMARAGGGNYWYVEQTTRWRRSSRARSRASSRSPPRTSPWRSASPIRGSPASASSSPTRSRRRASGWRVRLHDLYATSPKALGLVLHVEDVRELGKVKLGEVGSRPTW